MTHEQPAEMAGRGRESGVRQLLRPQLPVAAVRPFAQDEAGVADLLDLEVSFPTWPLYVIVPGLVLLIVGLVVRQEPGLGLTIAGSIVTTVGLVLLYQESTGHWATWTYAWALVGPTAAGVGMVLSGLVSDRPEWLHDGIRTTLAGLVLYAAEDPIDIRALGSRFQRIHRPTGFQHLARLWTAMKEYF